MLASSAINRSALMGMQRCLFRQLKELFVAGVFGPVEPLAPSTALLRLKMAVSAENCPLEQQWLPYDCKTAKIIL